MPASTGSPNGMFSHASPRQAGQHNNNTIIHSAAVVFNRDSEQRQDQPRDPWATLFERDAWHANVLRVANADCLPYLDLWHMWTPTGTTDTDDDLSESSRDVDAVVTQTPIVRVFGRLWGIAGNSRTLQQWPSTVDPANWQFAPTDRLTGNEVMYRPIKDTETDEVAIELPSSEAGDTVPAMKYTYDGRQFYGGLPRTLYTAGAADVLVLVERPAAITDGVGLIFGHFHG